MADIKDYKSNGDIAVKNRQYEEALKWYGLVLHENPNDVYCLSRSGAVSSGLGRHDEALSFFERAYRAAPDNGNNVYNFANSYLLRQDYSNGLKYLTEAEAKGVSDDILPKLYLQLAMICCMRSDSKSAHVYFDKSEKADKTGLLMLTPEVIAEKLKLYIAVADYENAEKMAAQLVAVNPTVFSFYLIRYSMTLVNKKIALAEHILDDAEKYAVMETNDKLTLMLQRSSLYIAMIEEDSSKKDEMFDKAEKLLKSSIPNYSDRTHKNLIHITLAELYNRYERYDEAISSVFDILGDKLHDLILIPDSNNKSDENTEIRMLTDEDAEYILTDEEWLEMEKTLSAELEDISKRMEAGLISDEPAGFYTDEYGNEVAYYDNMDYAEPDNTDTPKAEESEESISSNDTAEKMAHGFRDRVYFTLLTALLGKNDFENVGRCAVLLKNAENSGHSYFARYAEALAMNKLYGMTDETKQKYTLTIAYFRSRAIADSGNSLAAVFRARMYAELGEFEKAEDLTRILNDTDKKNILKYIEHCKNEQASNGDIGESNG